MYEVNWRCGGVWKEETGVERWRWSGGGAWKEEAGIERTFVEEER